ncbi:MAG: PAS domain-containing protein [Myxococcaceae bacterium]|nr:PAS domain-containing protein [Myxococcaceae bacterium]MCI0672404.1 PAS domain-containing protein [Myxococcaceae bacterium]
MPAAAPDVPTAEELTFTRLRTMRAQDFDALPFGLIQLDADGHILTYNATESLQSRVDKRRAVGRQYFEQVAPCTNTAAFRGRLDALAARGGGAESFDYCFRLPWGERPARIRLMVGEDGSRWVLVTKPGAAAASAASH